MKADVHMPRDFGLTVDELAQALKGMQKGINAILPVVTEFGDRFKIAVAMFGEAFRGASYTGPIEVNSSAWTGTDGRSPWQIWRDKQTDVRRWVLRVRPSNDWYYT